jgi:membrane protein YqaA with SNARE-associated domain
VRTSLTLLLAASSWARSLIGFFVGLGVLGPFLLEALDSSFFYAPLANELLLFALIHGGGGEASGWMWAAYAVSGAAGTVAGVALLDLLMRRFGAGGVERLVGRKKFGKLKGKVERNTGWVVFLASALPPPFPFRLTMMTASALQCARGRMLVAVFAARTLRFAAEALLILHFGRRFLDFMNSDAFNYVVYGLTLVAVAGSAVTIYRLVASCRERPEGAGRGAKGEGGGRGAKGGARK